jgi:hypothetical protein
MHHFDKCCLHLAVKMKDKTETVILKVVRCCQPAENSAAELKRGRLKKLSGKTRYIQYFLPYFFFFVSCQSLRESVYFLVFGTTASFVLQQPNLAGKTLKRSGSICVVGI